LLTQCIATLNEIGTLLDTVANKIVCPRENEEYQCGSACQTTCKNLGKPCPIINVVNALMIKFLMI